MAEKKEEHPADKYYRLKKKVFQMLHTYERSHRQIYDEAAGQHLMEDGRLKMELLENDDKQKAMAKHMSDAYISVAKQHFNIKPKKGKEGKEQKSDEAEDKMIARLVGGATYQDIYRHIKDLGEGFTFDYFNLKLRPTLMKNLAENLLSVPAEHLRPEHIGDLMGYVEKKQKSKLDFINKDALGLENAIKILDESEAGGKVLEKQHQKGHYFIPEKKRKKDKS
ncbi:hypothetical protein J4479_03285 [Candidatus Woesearchaeota archaeon]|nr:hypothetical protein [Candidatus Woesearchaeota archaeon]